MKVTRIALASILVALAIGTSQAQLTYTNLGVTAPPSTIRGNAADVNHLLTTAGTSSSFTLNSLPGLTFNNVTGLPFAPLLAVGFNGSFFVSAEASFLAKDSVDNNNFLSFGTVGSDTTLFANYGASSINTWRISSAGLITNPANDITFEHTDASMGITGTYNNSSIFHTFLASDANYNYFTFFIDDRASDPATSDFNDGVFFVRINTQNVGFTPVPEPSTYGLLGAVALFGVIYHRRRKSKTV